jgi:hypothetical protein
MVFRYFRTMPLRLISGVEQNAVHSTASMLFSMQLRSQANLNIDISPPLYTRVASVASATPLCAGHAQQFGGASPPANLMEVKA